MTVADSPRTFADEMIWMAWFLTGSEAASNEILRNVTCDGAVEQAPPLSLTQKARLAVVRAYYRVFGNASFSNTSGDGASRTDIEKNPILALPPAERSVFVLRLIMGQAEQDTARQLGISQKAISNLLSDAADRIARAFSGKSQYA